MLSKKYKKTTYKMLLATIVTLFALILSPLGAQVFATSAPAGCTGGPAGPPSPGTICPDGSIPVRDSHLPAGCPAGPDGPAVPGTVCPARPGRAQCTINGSQCLDVNNTDVSKGDAQAVQSTALTYTPAPTNCSPPKGQPLTTTNCQILNYVVLFTNVLAGLVGLVVVSVIIVGGIQYASAGNDPQKINAAKGRIFNALLALVVFIFMYAFLQWLIPGGLFG